MKKIIDGKRYDTETATEVAERSHMTRGDFSFVEETIYQTKKGAYFLYGYGHAMSKYAQYDGNMYGPGEEIRPLDDDEVLRLLEQWGETDALERLFPDSVVDA